VVSVLYMLFNFSFFIAMLFWIAQAVSSRSIETQRDKFISYARANDVLKLQRTVDMGLIDVNVVDDNGQTALHLAASKGALEAVCMLLKSGASVDIADKDGNTPYALAKLADHKHIFGFLHGSVAKSIRRYSLQSTSNLFADVGKDDTESDKSVSAEEAKYSVKGDKSVNSISESSATNAHSKERSQSAESGSELRYPQDTNDDSDGSGNHSDSNTSSSNSRHGHRNKDREMKEDSDFDSSNDSSNERKSTTSEISSGSTRSTSSDGRNSNEATSTTVGPAVAGSTNSLVLMGQAEAEMQSAEADLRVLLQKAVADNNFEVINLLIDYKVSLEETMTDFREKLNGQVKAMKVAVATALKESEPMETSSPIKSVSKRASAKSRRGPPSGEDVEMEPVNTNTISISIESSPGSSPGLYTRSLEEDSPGSTSRRVGNEVGESDLYDTSGKRVHDESQSSAKRLLSPTRAREGSRGSPKKSSKAPTSVTSPLLQPGLVGSTSKNKGKKANVDYGLFDTDDQAPLVKSKSDKSGVGTPRRSKSPGGGLVSKNGSKKKRKPSLKSPSSNRGSASEVKNLPLSKQ